MQDGANVRLHPGFSPNAMPSGSCFCSQGVGPGNSQAHKELKFGQNKHKWYTVCSLAALKVWPTLGWLSWCCDQICILHGCFTHFIPDDGLPQRNSVQRPAHAVPGARCKGQSKGHPHRLPGKGPGLILPSLALSLRIAAASQCGVVDDAAAHRLMHSYVPLIFLVGKKKVVSAEYGVLNRFRLSNVP